MLDSKQVKVDNWGIFFLQKLQQFFDRTVYCDLTLQFENNVQLKVHRLVLNACTEYFRVLEETCNLENNCLVMPTELPADVIVPIINFMYTGILEFHEGIFNRLYSAAQLLNMTVLTKLLDAQKVPIAPIPRQVGRRGASQVTWNVQGKKASARAADPDLPEPLPGRKLPVWRRRAVPTTYRPPEFVTVPDLKYYKREVDEAPKPTRFEWPDEEDASFDTSSFDEISYTSRPITVPAKDKNPRPSTSNFEELKRSTVKRPAPAPSASTPPASKRVNIQEVKEYLREQKLRSDYIEYDESEGADNDLQTYNDDDSPDEAPEKNGPTDPIPEETPSKSILKSDTSIAHNKRVRFSLEEKENSNEKPTEAPTIKTEPVPDMSNHTKIITEVLKKYPHLVKKNKNIRLKILAKGASHAGSTKTAVTTVPTTSTKPASKVSYMVMKPDVKPASNDKKDGNWTCKKCPEPDYPNFDSYYLYRKHLTDVHNEKTDSQMCNICGHTSRKQNMLVYHKYVKHGVEPPAMYQFPKCAECDYIAISNTLLVKHQQNHAHGPLTCAQCGISFASRTAKNNHIQQTGHVTKPDPISPSSDCSYCSAKFVSDEALFTHLRTNHRDEAHRDGLISAEEAGESKPVEDIKVPPAETSPPVEKPAKDNKIKILSDVKVSTPEAEIWRTPSNRKQNTETSVPVGMQAQEHSSEAESLSNVASGIAASLGLVNTIVVLDENQFSNMSGQEEYIIPDMSSMENNLPNLHVSQHQVITSESNTIISQATLGKANIASTDELVMVLTDHDYSDASSNTVLAPNSSNIVVLYSHPVQGQDGTQYMSQPSNLMLNTDMGIMEVDDQYAVANGSSLQHKQCEESIEMIQQEINSQLEPDVQIHTLEEEVVTFNEPRFPSGTLPPHSRASLQIDHRQQQYSEPMDAEESIELIQKEIQNSAEMRNNQSTVPYSSESQVEETIVESEVQMQHKDMEVTTELCQQGDEVIEANQVDDEEMLVLPETPSCEDQEMVETTEVEDEVHIVEERGVSVEEESQEMLDELKERLVENGRNLVGNEGEFVRVEQDMMEAEQNVVETEVGLGGSQQHLGGSEQHLVGDEQQFVGTEQQFVGTEQQFVGTEQQFVGTEQQFVGTEQHLVETQQHLNETQHLNEAQQGLVSAQQNLVGTQEQLSGTQQNLVGTQHLAGSQQDVDGTEQELVGGEQQHLVETQQHLVEPSENLIGNQQHIHGSRQDVVGTEQVLVEGEQNYVDPQQQNLIDAQQQNIVESQPRLIGRQKLSVGSQQGRVRIQQHVMETDQDLGQSQQDLDDGSQQHLSGNQELVVSQQDLGISKQRVVGTQQHVGGNLQNVVGTQQNIVLTKQHLGGSKKHVVLTQHVVLPQQHVSGTQQHVSGTQQHVGGTQQHVGATQQPLIVSQQQLISSQHLAGSQKNFGATQHLVEAKTLGKIQQLAGTQQELDRTQPNIIRSKHLLGSKHDLGKIQQHLVETQQNLVGSEQDLVETEQLLVGTQQDLVGTQQDLVGTQQDLVGTQQDLVGTQQDLVGTQQDLVGTQQDLVGTQQELLGTQQDLRETEKDLVGNEQNVSRTQRNLSEIQQYLVEDGQHQTHKREVLPTSEIKRSRKESNLRALTEDIQSSQHKQPKEIIEESSQHHQEEIANMEIVKTERPENEENILSSAPNKTSKEPPKSNCQKVPPFINPKISKLLDDWDDGDTDSQQSDTPKSTQAAVSSINTLIDDWNEEEET